MLLRMDFGVGQVAGLRAARRPGGCVAAGWAGVAGDPGLAAGPAAAA